MQRFWTQPLRPVNPGLHFAQASHRWSSHRINGRWTGEHAALDDILFCAIAMMDVRHFRHLHQMLMLALKDGFACASCSGFSDF